MYQLIDVGDLLQYFFFFLQAGAMRMVLTAECKLLCAALQIPIIQICLGTGLPRWIDLIMMEIWLDHSLLD